MAVTMLVKLTTKPGCAEEAQAAMVEAGPSVRRENGCIQYDFYSVKEQPETLYALEMWADEAALAAHSSSEESHMVTMREKLGPLLAAPLEIMTLSKFGE